MRIKDLIHQLQQLPEEQQEAAIDIFDERTGICQPINKLQAYDPKEKELSTLNPLLIVINRKPD